MTVYTSDYGRGEIMRGTAATAITSATTTVEVHSGALAPADYKYMLQGIRFVYTDAAGNRTTPCRLSYYIDQGVVAGTLTPLYPGYISGSSEQVWDRADIGCSDSTDDNGWIPLRYHPAFSVQDDAAYKIRVHVKTDGQTIPAGGVLEVEVELRSKVDQSGADDMVWDPIDGTDLHAGATSIISNLTLNSGGATEFDIDMMKLVAQNDTAEGLFGFKDDATFSAATGKLILTGVPTHADCAYKFDYAVYVDQDAITTPDSESTNNSFAGTTAANKMCQLVGALTGLDGAVGVAVKVYKSDATANVQYVKRLSIETGS